MNLAALRQQAAGINALAGMEFEMVVPGVASPDDDGEVEPDYDQDEEPSDIDDIIVFFTNGDNPLSNYESRRLRDQLQDKFSDWVSESVENDWAENRDSIVKQYAKDNYPEDEIEDEDFDWDAVEDEAYDDFESNYPAGEDDWLRDNRWSSMQDIAQEFDLEWPYIKTTYPEGETIEDVAKEFEFAVQRKVNWSNSYHGAEREYGAYSLEPDTSIEAPSGEAGLEFVSPPLPINEMIADLHKVRKWAGRYGATTNKSTGLHINVSVPGYSLEKLDFVKLALLLGDEYVLKQFGRSANHYCKSALNIVRDKVKYSPADAAAMLNQMKGHLGTMASKVIHSGNTDKYTSINTRDGYIEFRSPGGDWLDENFERIEATLLRFVVALDAAMDPQKYRQEYLKKLYKLLSAQQLNDPLAYFSRYVTGDMTKEELKNMIQSLQLEREVQKAPPGTVTKYVWLVTSTAMRGNIEVVATTRDDAINVAKKEWNLAPEQWPNDLFQARPLRRYVEQS